MVYGVETNLRGVIMSDYNGWKNYETWKIHLEILQDSYLCSEEDAYGVATTTTQARDITVDNLATSLEEYAREVYMVGVSVGNVILVDLVERYLHEVDFKEIANSYIPEVPPEPREHEEDES